MDAKNEPGKTGPEAANGIAARLVMPGGAPQVACIAWLSRPDVAARLNGEFCQRDLDAIVSELEDGLALSLEMKQERPKGTWCPRQDLKTGYLSY